LQKDFKHHKNWKIKSLNLNLRGEESWLQKEVGGQTGEAKEKIQLIQITDYGERGAASHWGIERPSAAWERRDAELRLGKGGVNVTQ